MKNPIVLSLLFITLSVITSCEKNYDSDIEIIENELIRFVNDNGITKCTIALLTNDGYTITHSNVSFSVNNGLVIVIDGSNEYRYSLNHLITYNLITTPTKLMYLYFQ